MTRNCTTCLYKTSKLRPHCTVADYDYHIIEYPYCSLHQEGLDMLQKTNISGQDGCEQYIKDSLEEAKRRDQ